MRSRALLVVLVGVALGTTGCAGTSAARPTTHSPTATVEPLAIPSAQVGEIVRTTFEGGTIDTGTARLPEVAALSVVVACSGPDGSTMRWALRTASGRMLGLSGVQDCTGPTTTSGLGLNEAPTGPIEVEITPGATVTAGYAIVRRGGE